MSSTEIPRPIYLDYNATTPMDPRVAETMRPLLTSCFGNPSSGHFFGQEAKTVIVKARLQVANMLEVTPDQIVFTSGGTEANNHAIMGAALGNADGKKHLVTSAVEHPAVFEVFHFLETLGFQTTFVAVDKYGQVDAKEMIQAMTPDTVLVSLMHANNEVGTLQPVSEVAAAASQRGILMHTDCAQSAGKVPVSLAGLGVDMLSLAGHKLYGPKGVGVLCLRKGLKINNLMHGAPHEKGRRPGTENILEIAGLGAACQLVHEELADKGRHLSSMRDHLEKEILKAIPGAQVHGHPTQRLPNTLSVGFAGASAGDIMSAMPEVAISAGAACHGGGEIISHVLSNMGVDNDIARGTLRLSTGRMTTEDEIKKGLAALVKAVGQARG